MQIRKKKFTTKEFITQAKLVHGNKYDYSKTIYKGAKTKICIICPVHGEFWQEASSHIVQKSKCSKCVGNKTSNTEEFINKSNKIHNNKYNYFRVQYISAHKNVIICCPKHGEFLCTPHNHLRCKGCPTCNNSAGENLIQKILLSYNLVHNTQFKFLNCRQKRLLPFDFYIPSLNIAIEYQGIQHYYPVKQFGGWKQYFKTYENDIIKHNFCIEQGVNLIEIPYWEQSNIEKIIEKAINTAQQKDPL